MNQLTERNKMKQTNLNKVHCTTVKIWYLKNLTILEWVVYCKEEIRMTKVNFNWKEIPAVSVKKVVTNIRFSEKITTIWNSTANNMDNYPCIKIHYDFFFNLYWENNKQTYIISSGWLLFNSFLNCILQIKEEKV